MSRTRSQLDALMKLRSRTRDAARRELGDALRAAGVLAQEQEQLELAIAQLADERRAALAQANAEPERMLATGRYDLVLRARGQAMTENRQKIEQEIDRRRATLAEAEREVRVIEKLEEREAERARVEAARRERRLTDELNAQRHAQRVAADDDADLLLPLR
ncbi:MAG: flagellar FliJ family protein [Planctomycetota bacterium]